MFVLGTGPVLIHWLLGAGLGKSRQQGLVQLQSWRARLLTGASCEALVDNARFWLQSWRARLSMDAPREVPVDNKRFSIQDFHATRQV